MRRSRRIDQQTREALVATRATLGIIEPMGAVADAISDSLIAHHAGGELGMENCPICATYADRIQAALDRWHDAHALAAEHVVDPDG